MSRNASIKISPREDGCWSVIIDGVEVGDQILAEGFAVTDFDSHAGTARVHLTFETSDLTADIPNAVVA